MAERTAADTSADQGSSYMDYLPAIFQQDTIPGQPNFLGRFLLAFEHILTGRGDPELAGIEEKLDGVGQVAGIQRYFEPGPDPPDASPAPNDNQRAPETFLDWLASWVALTLRADLDESTKREFIARAVSLYKLRGTRAGLEELLRIHTRLGPSIDEMVDGFELGSTSTVGVDTVLDGGAPHFFKVRLLLPAPDPTQRSTQTLIARAIIDMEKPAHTMYWLDVDTPAMQINVYSTVGVDTLLSESSS